ncbi:DUF4332 domain-containing protein [Gimesia maris]|uniref:DUF4332 domain-containing protein n=1 Tax=Gimesia maris TaxID=122 RepID=UPI00241E346D|nr:DUF4332 domain-containing protein [Gimesia maris]|tara:strand:- start:16274 stop:20503 length:4230 start_codon:yes stop_codon:yes gene_type:complete
MKITRIHVNQFGNWQDLNLAALDPGINVFYGPNETGKSTLMRMIRGILYGFQSDELREHSRVPDSVPWSALLDIRHQGQFYEIQRQTTANGRGHFSFQSQSRGTSGTELLTSLQSGVNESVYENVFAIGLNELQELGTLHGDQVAQHIYGLTLGPEGQAILDASKAVSHSRQALLSRDAKSGKLPDLYQQLEEIDAKLADLKQQSQRFFNLSDDLQKVRAESDSLKKRKSGLQYQIRGHRFLDRVWKPWQEVQDLQQQLIQLPVVAEFPEDGVNLLNEYDREIKQVETKLNEIQTELSGLRKQIEQAELDNDLLNFAPSIQSLVDQKPWMTDLEQQHQSGITRVQELETILQNYLNQNQNLGHVTHVKTTPDNNQRLIEAAREYRLAGAKRKNAHRRYKKVSRKYQQTLASLQERSARLLNGHSIEAELKRARERMKHLERLSQLRVRESEFVIRQEAAREQLERLQTNSRLPGWAKKTLFGFAIAGVFLVLAGFWRGVSDAKLVGLIYCLSGLFLGGITWAIKKHFELDVQDQAEELQDESWALDVHLRETRQEIERIMEDEYFALKSLSEGHSLSSHRQRESVPALNFNDENILRTDLLHELALKIAELEQLEVDQQQAQKTRQLLVKLRNRSQEIQRNFSSKRHEWCECLKQLGLTETLKVDDAFRMWHQVSQANLYRNQRELEQQKIKPCGDLVDMYFNRVRELSLRMNRRQQNTENPFEQVAAWERELETISSQREERARLMKQEQRLRQEADALKLKREEFSHLRSTLLIQGGAASREDFLKRAASMTERIQIEKTLATAQRELERASQSEQEMAIVEEDLLNFDAEANAEHLEMLNLELEDIEQDLVTTAENMGRLKQDYQNAKTDRSAVQLRFQREQILEQIRQASEEWFTTELSAVGLQKLQAEFERTSQPETLAIASDYLRQLTNGRYCNIWTPLGEQYPKVDDNEGHTLTVSELSSGTREQLFLAIRLAMVERFRNNGVELPMVLDDVLVNFDQSRTQAAIETLISVAEKGQQILFFTCHLHLTRLFEEQGKPAVWLTEESSKQETSSPRLSQLPVATEQQLQPAPSNQSSTAVLEGPLPAEPIYQLEWLSPLHELSSLNQFQIQKLNQAGIHSIAQLLSQSADELSTLSAEEISAGLIFEWQSQARLASCIRGIKPQQATFLVQCGITEPGDITSMSCTELWSLIDSSLPAETSVTEALVQEWFQSAHQARTFQLQKPTPTEQKPQQPAPQERRDYRRDGSHSDSGNTKPITPPFYLNRSMPVEQAPSIGPKTAHRLEKVGIFSVNDFLECNPENVANQLNVSHIKERTIRIWKKQAKLVCCVPGLRGHDAQILVACGFYEPDQIVRTSPQELYGKVKSFVKTSEGQQIIRGGKRPDFNEITDWIQWSQKARKLHAA